MFIEWSWVGGLTSSVLRGKTSVRRISIHPFSPAHAHTLSQARYLFEESPPLQMPEDDVFRWMERRRNVSPIKTNDDEDKWMKSFLGKTFSSLSLSLTRLQAARLTHSTRKWMKTYFRRFYFFFVAFDRLSCCFAVWRCRFHSMDTFLTTESHCQVWFQAVVEFLKVLMMIEVRTRLLVSLSPLVNKDHNGMERSGMQIVLMAHSGRGEKSRVPGKCLWRKRREQSSKTVEIFIFIPTSRGIEDLK